MIDISLCRLFRKIPPPQKDNIDELLKELHLLLSELNYI